MATLLNDRWKSIIQGMVDIRRAMRSLTVEVSIYEGLYRQSGTSIRILGIGNQGVSEFLRDRFLTEDRREIPLGRQNLLAVRQMIGHPERDQIDILLASVPRLIRNWLRGPNSFLIPTWVKGELSLETLWSAPPSSSWKSDLKLIRKHRLRPRIIERPTEFRDFYDAMHVPYIQETHASLAEIVPYEEMALRFQHSDLVLVEHDGAVVGGGGIDDSTGVPTLFALGLREPFSVHRDMGVIAAVYQFCFERMAAKGYSRAGMGYSRPLLDDGVLRFKRKFGMEIVDGHPNCVLLRVLRITPAIQALLESTPFIHRDFNTNLRAVLTGAVFQTGATAPDAAALIRLARQYDYAGLNELVLHSWGAFPPQALPRQRSSTMPSATTRPTSDGNNPNSSRNSMPYPNPLPPAVSLFLDQLARMRSGESVLLCTDETTDPVLQQALADAIGNRGGAIHPLEIPTQLDLAESAIQIAESVRRHSATLMIELGDRSFYQSSAWDDAVAAGARIYSLVSLDSEAFVRCVGGADHVRLREFGESLHRILVLARNIEFSTTLGMALTMQARQTRVSRWVNRLLRRPSAWTWKPTGVLRDDLPATFLGGQVSFRPDLHTLTGTAVIDGYLWPPRDCGRLQAPLQWRFEKGWLTSIDGPRETCDSLRTHLGQTPARLEHFCLGFLPQATLQGGLHEAERRLGCLVVGIGQGASHTDGIVTGASITIDGKPLLQNGSFVHPDLPNPAG